MSAAARPPRHREESSTGKTDFMWFHASEPPDQMCQAPMLARTAATFTHTALMERRGVRRITIGRINVEQTDDESTGIAAARRVYGSAVETAESLWQAAKA